MNWYLLIVWALIWLLNAIEQTRGFDAAVYGYLVLTIGLSLVYWRFYRLDSQSSPKLRSSNLIVLFLFAATSPTILETDQYRYVWDGLVGWNGENPFAQNPQSYTGPLAASWWKDLINHDHLHTIYPPLSQLLFLLSTALNPYFWPYILGFETIPSVGNHFQLELGWKIMIALAVVCTAKLYQSRRWDLILLHPLVLLQFLVNGHLDGFLLPIFAIVFLQNSNLAQKSVGLSAAALIKIFPIFLIPFLSRKMTQSFQWGILCLVLCAASFWLYSFGSEGHLFSSLFVYGEKWQFFSFFQAIFVDILEAFSLGWQRIFISKVIGIGLGVLFSLWVFIQFISNRISSIESAYWFLIGFWCLFPTIHPWYLICLIPFGAYFKNIYKAGIVWPILSLCSIYQYVHGQDPILLRYVLYFVVSVMLFFDGRSLWRRIHLKNKESELEERRTYACS